MKLIFRIFAGSFLVFLGVAGVSYMQKRFDDGDEKKALAALTALAAKTQGLPDPASCRAEMESRVKGDVRVSCGERSWIVNVLSAKIAEEHGSPSP